MPALNILVKLLSQRGSSVQPGDEQRDSPGQIKTAAMGRIVPVGYYSPTPESKRPVGNNSSEGRVNTLRSTICERHPFRMHANYSNSTRQGTVLPSDDSRLSSTSKCCWSNSRSVAVAPSAEYSFTARPLVAMITLYGSLATVLDAPLNVLVFSSQVGSWCKSR